MSELGRIQIRVMFRWSDPVFYRRSDPDTVLNQKSDPVKIHTAPQPCLRYGPSLLLA